jgi:hypothetical protein
MQRARRALEAAFADDGGQCGEGGVVQHAIQFYFIGLSRSWFVFMRGLASSHPMNLSADSLSLRSSPSSCKAWR